MKCFAWLVYLASLFNHATQPKEPQKVSALEEDLFKGVNEGMEHSLIATELQRLADEERRAKK